MVKLGELVEFNPPAEAGDLPDSTPVSFVPMRAVEEETGRVSTSEIRTLGQVRKGYTPFREGDLLFAKITPCMGNGKIAIAPAVKNGLGFGSTELMVLRPYGNLEIRYLWHFLLQCGFRSEAEAKMQGAVGQKRVPKSFMEGYLLPLPPPKEQQRIVARIGELFSGLDTAIAEAKTTLGKLRELRQTVLRDAFNGELTRTWRDEHTNIGETAHQLLGRILRSRRTCQTQYRLASLRRRKKAEGLPPSKIREVLAKERSKIDAQYMDPDQPSTSDSPSIPDGWVWTTLETYADVAGGVTVDKNRRTSKPLRVPYLRVANVQRGHIDLSDVKTIEVEAHELPFLLLRKGDILLNEGGDRDKLGRGWVWNGELPRCTHQNHVFRARPFISDFDPRFVSHYINEFAQGYFFERATQTTNLASISKSRVNKLPIPLPHFEEHRMILAEIDRHMKAADSTEAEATSSIANAEKMRHAILRDAFSGKLVAQDPCDEPAFTLVQESLIAKARLDIERKQARQTTHVKRQRKMGTVMQKQHPQLLDVLRAATDPETKATPDPRELFERAGYQTDEVSQFYQDLRADREALGVYLEERDSHRRIMQAGMQFEPFAGVPHLPTPGRFRLHSLWLGDFKNLKDYEVRFDQEHSINAVLGWNGTGKSNLFEALVIIFRDLLFWRDYGRPLETSFAYRLQYEVDDQPVVIDHSPERKGAERLRIECRSSHDIQAEPLRKGERSKKSVPLPHYVLGYYSGPSNRLQEHFLTFQRFHYDRLLKLHSDDERAMQELLDARKLFCAETKHSKFVMLAFFYREDDKVRAFLKDKLRIVGFESALFVLRRPPWAKTESACDFWGAKGLVRSFLERLHGLSVAEMCLTQRVPTGYKTHNTEEHYYLFIPDHRSLIELASEYGSARNFFAALESTDFSEIIHDVKIQVRILAAKTDEASVTYRELSEGEQQLLMVLGLLRFTKANQSLVLLDEPDTHLNPQWSSDYLSLLTSLMSEEPTEAWEQRTSHILVCTHDPLVIAGLEREQIRVLKRDENTGRCYAETPVRSPKGMGFEGVLTSEIFGFRSALDTPTLKLLDEKRKLAAKEQLDDAQKKRLAELSDQLADLDFASVMRDDYYRLFVRAMARWEEGQGLLPTFETKADGTRDDEPVRILSPEDYRKRQEHALRLVADLRTQGNSHDSH